MAYVDRVLEVIKLAIFNRKRLWGLVKSGLLATLLLWAYRKGLLSKALANLESLSFFDGSLAFLALGITIFCGVVRWRWILRTLNLPEPSYLLGLRLYYEGLFYNTFAPGAIGGDLLRAHWLRAKDQKNSKLHYLVTLGERAMGLGTLGILGVWAWFGVMWMLGYIIIAIIIISLIPKLTQYLNSRWAISLPQHLKLSWIYAAVLLNTLSHLISFTIYILIGHSLGVQLTIMEWVEALSITVLAANLPLSVAGIGPREIALVTLLAHHGVTNELAIAISMGALAMLMVHATLGGVIHAATPSTEPSPT